MSRNLFPHNRRLLAVLASFAMLLMVGAATATNAAEDPVDTPSNLTITGDESVYSEMIAQGYTDSEIRIDLFEHDIPDRDFNKPPKLGPHKSWVVSLRVQMLRTQRLGLPPVQGQPTAVLSATTVAVAAPAPFDPSLSPQKPNQPTPLPAPPPTTAPPTTTTTAPPAQAPALSNSESMSYVNGLTYCVGCKDPVLEAFRVAATARGWTKAERVAWWPMVWNIISKESKGCWNVRRGAKYHGNCVIDKQGRNEDAGFSQIIKLHDRLLFDTFGFTSHWDIMASPWNSMMSTIRLIEAYGGDPWLYADANGYHDASLEPGTRPNQ